MSRPRWAPAAVLVLVLLAACAPVTQMAGRPDAGFAGPRIDSDAFVSFDGTRLPLTRWLPEDREPWAVIVALHGMNSYAGAYHQAGPHWARDGIATYAYDQRGFGAAPHRGVWGGEALFTEDLRTITALVRARHPGAIIVVAGASMGGSVAIEAFASDRPPAADRLLLLSPAVWDRALQPRALAFGTDLLAHIAPAAAIPIPGALVRGHPASDNEAEVEAAAIDPEVIWRVRPDAVYGLSGLMDHAAADIGKIRTPMAYFYGAHDHVIPAAAAARAAARLGPGARTAYYADGWHYLLLDRQAARVMDDAESFIRDPVAPFPSGAGPIPATPSGRPAEAP